MVDLKGDPTIKEAMRGFKRIYQSFRQVLRRLIPLAWRRRVVRLWRGETREVIESKWQPLGPLARMMERTVFADYDIVCFPVIDWDFRFQRPQQLMLRMAQAGHRVFYLSQHFRTEGDPVMVYPHAPNLYEVSLRGNPQSIYTESLDQKAIDRLFSSISTLRQECRLGSTLALVQLPFWWPLVHRTRDLFGWKVLYDCMDYHSGFTLNHPEMLQVEDELLAQADLVIVSSTFLERQARPHNSKISIVRNGCDYPHFSQVPADIFSVADNRRPVIGYYGAIADWFDADLVADLAKRRPDWDLILIGSTVSADISRLSNMSNVNLAGEQPYQSLPSWLRTIDVLIIPFKRNELTEATNPVKAYEILAAGKPLVSVPLPEVVALGPIVQLASTAEEFEREILQAIQTNSLEKTEERRRFAAEHTWEERVASLEPRIRDLFHQRQ